MSTRNVSLMEAAIISPEFFSIVDPDGTMSDLIHADGWTALPDADRVVIRLFSASDEHDASEIVLVDAAASPFRVAIVDMSSLADELIAEAERILRSAAD